jgi:type IV pilus assembly protein PilY1
MNFSLAANPTAVDLNNDGFVDRVYIGDVAGQVWKFDVTNGTPANWTGKRVFAARLFANEPAAGRRILSGAGHVWLAHPGVRYLDAPLAVHRNG